MQMLRSSFRDRSKPIIIKIIRANESWHFSLLNMRQLISEIYYEFHQAFFLTNDKETS